MKKLIAAIILLPIIVSADENKASVNFEVNKTSHWVWYTDSGSGLCRLDYLGISKYCSRLTREDVLSEISDEIIESAKSEALYKCAANSVKKCQVVAVYDNVFLNRDLANERGGVYVNVKEAGREVQVLVRGEQ